MEGMVGVWRGWLVCGWMVGGERLPHVQCWQGINAIPQNMFYGNDIVLSMILKAKVLIVKML